MIKIKTLTKDYIDTILKFENESAPQLPVYYPYDETALAALFSSNNNKVFGAFDGDKLVGWASYRYAEKEDGTDKGVYEMSSLVVDKNYRRQGIGLKLFKTRLDELLQKTDLTKIYATNYPKNIPIILLYLNNGFVIYDYKKDVYGKGGDRIYVMYEKI